MPATILMNLSIVIAGAGDNVLGCGQEAGDAGIPYGQEAALALGMSSARSQPD
jgi:hypothetical protein